MTGAGLIVTVVAFACFGALCGLAHWKLLAWNVRAFAGRSRSLFQAWACLGRAILTPCVFVLAMPHGAAALVATLVGFLGSRTIALRRPEIFLP